MTGLQWLRLDKTNLTDIPEELGKLMKLVSSPTCPYCSSLNLFTDKKKTVSYSVLCINFPETSFKGHWFKV